MKARWFPPFLAIATPLFLLMVGIQVFDAHAQPSRQNGIAYVAYQSGAYSQPDADLALSDLASTGANWISLLVTGYQDTITSTTIYTTSSTPTDADLIHVITTAHRLGLKVMLKPHLEIASDPAAWRGFIGQGFTAMQWTAWFASYQNFINHYALLAQDHGVEQFCIGTELSATQGRANNWRTVITGVRNHYHGPITYAANWVDGTGITWWDAVDYIGVDAYYELTTKNNPTLAELKAAWQPHLATLAALAATWHKLILFSEIGYRSIDGANKQPWNWQITGTIDLQEQADAYRAVFESVYDQPWFAGMFWWSWSTYVYEGGLCDKGYSPHDKPAEEVLRTWYGGPPPIALQPGHSQPLEIYTDSLGSGWEDWSWWTSARNLAAADQVYSGTRSISVTFQGWGAVALYHPAISVAPYFWLEFYMRESVRCQLLVVSINDENDAPLRQRLVQAYRYLENGTLEPGGWKRVRIPLTDLDAPGHLIGRVSIQNWSSQPSAFWFDEIRLVGANLPVQVYLPTVVRN